MPDMPDLPDLPDLPELCASKDFFPKPGDKLTGIGFIDKFHQQCVQATTMSMMTTPTLAPHTL
ncbi:hypothetical protein [Dickeya lacustris]|uniref:Uncharacterized protein n=1 Tax=Dickeya lacustris TaxID=2259638 RepID=A0ABY8G4T6_9GAMM|nr:hypothetical protein [Dickeya lacustris]WFN54966.1 hypothetical protein O1Q98_15115 [Dickeya lacustris]